MAIFNFDLHQFQIMYYFLFCNLLRFRRKKTVKKLVNFVYESIFNQIHS